MDYDNNSITQGNVKSGGIKKSFSIAEISKAIIETSNPRVTKLKRKVSDSSISDLVRNRTIMNEECRICYGELGVPIQQLIPYHLFHALITTKELADKLLQYIKDINPMFHSVEEIIEVIELLKLNYSFKKSINEKTAKVLDLKDILELTYPNFRRYALKDNIEWVNLPSLTEDYKILLWDILEMNLKGLSHIKTQDVVSNMDLLKIYSDAFSLGEIDGVKTIQLLELNSIQEIANMTTILVSLKVPMPLIYKSISKEDFCSLTLEQGMKLFEYCEKLKPSFSFKKNREGSAIKNFIVKLPDVRALKAKLKYMNSFHKFNEVCIRKLLKDLDCKYLPLTIILFPSHDPSGAFTLSKELSTIILNPRIKVIVVESGQISMECIQSIIEEHGRFNKLAQLVIAGHGSSKSININLNGDKVSDKTAPSEMLTYNSPAWTEFFKMIKGYMDKTAGLPPKILLDACNTGSRDFDFKVLKGLDEDEARNIMKKQIETPRNMVNFIQKITNIEVLGAEGSINSKMKVINDDGSLCLNIPGAVTTNIDYQRNRKYVKEGKDPGGVMRALLSGVLGVSQKYESKVLNDFIGEGRKVTNYQDFFINVLFSIIKNGCRGNIVLAAKSIKAASLLQGVFNGGIIPFKLILADEFIQAFHKELCNPLIHDASFIDGKAKFIFIQVLYHMKAINVFCVTCFLESISVNESIFDYLYENHISEFKDKAFLESEDFVIGKITLALLLAKKFSDVHCISFIENIYYSNDAELKAIISERAENLGVNLEVMIGLSVNEISEEFIMKPIQPFVPLLLKENQPIIMDFKKPMIHIKPVIAFSKIVKIGEIYGMGHKLLYIMVRLHGGQIGYIEVK